VGPLSPVAQEGFGLLLSFVPASALLDRAPPSKGLLVLFHIVPLCPPARALPNFFSLSHRSCMSTVPTVSTPLAPFFLSGPQRKCAHYFVGPRRKVVVYLFFSSLSSVLSSAQVGIGSFRLTTWGPAVCFFPPPSRDSARRRAPPGPNVVSRQSLRL